MKLSFINKKILAPMVRIGTLPMRLLSLEFGCDIVYTEELIDWKLIRAERIENELLGTVDFVDRSDGSLVFRTCSIEKSKVILQMGTSDPERALKAAKLVEKDVAGIDVNMGCPKEFSVKGGMGAALLCDPNRAVAIMSTLVQGLSCPVTCKVRILPDPEETVKFCKRLADCGISAIAIHGRIKTERPQHQNHNDVIKLVAESLSIPVIANGGSLEIETYEDMDKFQKETNCSSVMVARAAQWNCSIFRKAGKLPVTDVIISYLKYSVDYDSPQSNTKYCVLNMMRDMQDTPKGKLYLGSHTLEQQCDIWGLGDYCKKKLYEYRRNGVLIRREAMPEGIKRNLAEEGVIELKCAFIRHMFTADVELPKSRVLMLARKNGYKDPTYETEQLERRFRTILSVGGLKYASSFWEKNKRWSEQAAALVCLCSLGLVDNETLKLKGALRWCYEEPLVKKIKLST